MEREHGGIDPRQERALLLTLITLCASLITVGVVLGSECGVAQPLERGDLSEAHIVEIRAPAGVRCSAANSGGAQRRPGDRVFTVPAHWHTTRTTALTPLS